MFLCVATKRLRMWKALSVNNTIMPTHRAGCRAQNQINFGTPSSRRRVDGVEVDTTIQHEGAVKF